MLWTTALLYLDWSYKQNRWKEKKNWSLKAQHQNIESDENMEL